MLKKVWPLLLVVGLIAPVQGSHRDTLAKFDGGIGVIPVSNVVVNATTGAITVNRNIVRGVDPAGQLWVIEDLKAEVRTDGRIRVRGRGLLFGGGNNTGLAGNNISVIATLICDTAAPFTQHSNPTPAPLAADGDFRIDDVLTTVPAQCDSPVLLIRNAANGGGGWFAAGIPDFGGRNDD
jgi:hypothetical protein